MQWKYEHGRRKEGKEGRREGAAKEKQEWEKEAEEGLIG